VSLIGSVMTAVEAAITAATEALTRKDTEQDQRLDRVEERLGALESPPPSARKVRPGAADSKAQASGT
jgi:hypothetical protein